LSRRQQDENWGWGCLLLLALLVIVGGAGALVNWFNKHPQALLLTGVVFCVVLLVGGYLDFLIVRRREQERLQAEEERQERVRQLQAERQEHARQREAAKRRRIEAMLHPDRVRDEIHFMSGPEFERFMADLLRQKGYEVEETPLSGDQGVDLILPDLDGKRVVIQLKRWTGPVGNKAIQATFAGMAHYQADEGWIITTSTFTKSARELARSTSVRLIDRDEFADWLEGLREEEEGTPDSVERQAQRRRRRRRR
jgi:restriction endonuclease Mrr